MNMAPKLQLPRQTGSKAATSQKGVTLVVGLIMLMMITMLVVGAFTLSSTNLTAVGNMQVREEAIASANLAIEQVMSSPFTDAPVAQEINVDINKDGINDYLVKLEAPTCIKALVLSSGGGVNEFGFGSGGVGGYWSTEWDINASVTDASNGASVRIRQGIRVMISDAQKNLVCP